MELNQLANRGKLINGLIVFANAITFIVYMIGRRHFSSWYDLDAIQKIITAQNVVRIIAGAIGVGGLVYTIILMGHNPEKKIKGFGTLLAACIVTVAFAAIGIMLGIVIWILSGISIRQLDQSFKEASTTDSWDRYAQNVVGNQYGGTDIYGSPYGNQDAYGNQQYGSPYSQNAYGDRQYGSPYGNQDMYGGQGAYAGQNAYNYQQMQQNVPPQNIPAPKVASHPNGFGVQEEPEIDFSDL